MEQKIVKLKDVAEAFERGYDRENSGDPLWVAARDMDFDLSEIEDFSHFTQRINDIFKFIKEADMSLMTMEEAIAYLRNKLCTPSQTVKLQD